MRPIVRHSDRLREIFRRYQHPDEYYLSRAPHRIRRKPTRRDILAWARRLERLTPQHSWTWYTIMLRQTDEILRPLGFTTRPDQLAWLAQWPLAPGVLDRMQFISQLAHLAYLADHQEVSHG